MLRKGYRWLSQPKETDTTETRKRSLLIVAVLIFCVIGVMLISHFLLKPNSIRLDEAQSLWQTSHSLSGTLKVVAEDVHVPLYHVVLHFWQIAFGQSIETARTLSLGFFIATIPIVYLLARRALSTNWSLVVVTLFSFSPFMNWYANEARMYTLLVFISTLSQYFFLRLVENSKDKKAWYGYGITAVVGAYSHYFFAFNLLSQAIYYLLTRKKFAAGSFKKLVGIGFSVAAALAPWIYYFVKLGSAKNTAPNLITPSSVDLFNVFSQFSFGYQTNAINTFFLSLWPVLVIVALLAVKKEQKINPKISYLLAAGILPVMIAFGLSFVRSPFFLSRYMVSCVAPLIIVLIWFISHYGKRFSRIVVFGLVTLLVATSIRQYASAATPVKENYSGAAQYISARATANDVVVLSAPFTVYPFDYYYEGKARISTLPIWDRTEPSSIPEFNPQDLPRQVDSLIANHQYIYLLVSYDQGYQDDLVKYFDSRFPRTTEETFSDDLSLYRYQVGYYTVPQLAPPPGREL